MSEHNSISEISEELDRVILWQYDNSNLVGFVQLLADFLGQSTKQFWEDWQRDVVNIDTANDFGLAVWGKVLGLSRPLIATSHLDTSTYTSEITGLMRRVDHAPAGVDSNWSEKGQDHYWENNNFILFYLDFEDDRRMAVYRKSPGSTYPYNDGAGAYTSPPGVDPDYFEIIKAGEFFGAEFTHGTSSTQNPISTELFRKIIKARFELMNSSSTTADYIKYVNAIFGEDTVSVTDGNDMSLSFGEYTGEDEELAELPVESLIPYPAGVRDNSEADGRFLAFVEDDEDVPDATLYPRAGGFDESTFNWKEGENINDAS